MILVLLCSPHAKAVVIHHDVPPSAAAALAAQAPFAPVVRIEVAAFGTRTGSGVVVADGWVLTPAHVLWGAPAFSVGVRISGQFSVADELRFSDGWSTSPSIGITQGSDLALIRLASTGMTPAMIATDVRIGEVAFLGGFFSDALGMASSVPLHRPLWASP